MDTMRERVLKAAATILAEEGAAALSVRRVAAEVGASTKVVYSGFGGMPGLVDALYAEGFRRMNAALEAAASSARTGGRLAAAAAAYRRFMQENAAFFDIMYGPRIRTLKPGRDDRTEAREGLAVLAASFRAEGRGAAAASERARAFWCAIHGPVALERAGWIDARECARRIRAAVEAAAAAEG